MKVFYVSTIFKRISVARRFLKFFSEEFPIDTAELYLYCHDQQTFDVSKSFLSENIHLIKGSESIFYTEAVNILLKIILKKRELGNICLLDSDCFTSENLHEICMKNNNKAIIFRNRDFKTKKLLPSGFLIKNKITGSSVDIEKIISKKKQYHKIDFSNGRGLTFPINFVRKNGLLNHIDFPLYASDNEYSWKLSRKLGLYYYTNAEIFSNKEETSFNPAVLKFSFRKRIKALFSKRSNINLIMRFKYSKAVCPNNLYKPIWIIRSISSALLVAFLPFFLVKKLTKFK